MLWFRCCVLSTVFVALGCTDKQERHAPDSSTQAQDAGPGDSGVGDASQTPGKPAACEVEAPRACQEPKPTYSDVEPIFKDRCVICHNGKAGGPWPLTTYGHVADWQNEIRDQVSRCTMPPADAGVAISDAERLEILMWLRCGLTR